MRSTASLRESAGVAAASLNANKLRSFLTLLGVILATATLIVVMSVVHGMDLYIAEEVSDMGTDGFRVTRIPILGDFDPKKYLELEKKNPKLTLDEFLFLKSQLTQVREFGIETGSSVSVKYKADHLENVDLGGVSPNIGVIQNKQAATGRFLTDIENVKRMDVVFLGYDVRERFFPSVDPVGKTVHLDGRPFEVVGTAKKQGSVFGQSRDNFVMIPVATYLKTFNPRPDMNFSALALDRYHLEDAQSEARVLLRARRHLRPTQEDNFGLVASDSLVAIWDRLTGMISATAVGIVSVFMVVGGVVIMNIMLAVVTERTHEIGIRKAVGARKRDILSQFLVESSLLSATGGAMGVLVAWCVSVAVTKLTPVPMAMPVSAIFVGVGLSATVGLFFGVFPAKRASDLDPIEALRTEV